MIYHKHGYEYREYREYRFVLSDKFRIFAYTMRYFLLLVTTMVLTSCEHPAPADYGWP